MGVIDTYCEILLRVGIVMDRNKKLKIRVVVILYLFYDNTRTNLITNRIILLGGGTHVPLFHLLYFHQKIVYS